MSNVRWVFAALGDRTDAQDRLAGHAVIPLGVTRSLSDAFRVRHPKREHVQEARTVLHGPSGQVDAERAAAAVLFCRGEPFELGTVAMTRLLGYDEAVLRAEVARAWLSADRHDDESILAQIFAEQHPACALGALQGAIRGWPSHPKDRRDRVLGGLKESVRNSRASARGELGQRVRRVNAVTGGRGRMPPSLTRPLLSDPTASPRATSRDTLRAPPTGTPS